MGLKEHVATLTQGGGGTSRQRERLEISAV